MLTSSRPNFRTAAEVTAGILVLLSLHGWMQYRDARDALHEQRAHQDRCRQPSLVHERRRGL